MSKLDIQGKLKINSSGILELNGNPYVDFNAAGQLALGNQDWLPLCGETTYLSHPGSSQADAQGTVSSVYFDYNAGGMKFVGQGTVHIQTRIPVDKFSKYRIKVRVKKTVQAQNTITTPSAKTDLDYFYCGVSNYDSDHVNKFTDSATTYNYGVALAQPLYEDGSITSNTSSHAGHGTTGNSDGEYVFENTISGFNLASEGDHTKFDPGTSYFNIVIICNYIGFGSGTSDLTEAIKGETIIQNVEVERVSSWGGNDIDSPADTPSYFSHPAQQYYPGSMPTDYDSSWDGLVQMAARGSWVEGDASGSKDGRGWAFWPSSGQGNPTLFIQEQKSNTPTELGKPGNMNYPAGIAGEKNESIRNVPLWLVGQYEQGDLLVGSNHPVARFQQNYTIPSRTSPNGDYIDINVVGWADDSLSSVDYAGMGIESGWGNLFLGSRNIHKQSDGGTYFPELTTGPARNEWGMIIDMKNLVHIGIPSGVDEGNWRRMDVAYGREVLNLHGAAKFTSITGPRAGSGSQGAGTLWWRDDTGPGAFYYRAPDGTDKVLGSGDVTFNYSGTLWEGYNADRIGTDNTVHFSKTSLNQLDLNPQYYQSTSTAGMALGCGWGQSDGMNRPAIQMASAANSGWSAIYLNKVGVTGPEQSGNDTRWIQFAVNGQNDTSFRSSGSDGRDFQIITGKQISLTAHDGVAISDEEHPKEAYAILDVEGSNGDQGGQLYVSSTEDFAENNGGGILFGAKVSASNRALTAGIHGVKSNGTDGDYKGDLIFTTRSGSAGTTNDLFQSGSIMPERMRINSDGYVGIGTSSPAAHLHVTGQGYFSRNSPVSAPLYTKQEGSGPSAYFMGGNVGIGTTTPFADVAGWENRSGALHIQGAQPRLRLQDDEPASDGAWDIINNGGDLFFQSRQFDGSGNHIEGLQSNKIKITQAGKVGIGTDSPSANLEVRSSGPSMTSSFLLAEGGGDTGGIEISTNTVSTYRVNITHDDTGFVFSNNATASRPYAFLDGNVGINVANPAAKLEIETSSQQQEGIIIKNSSGVHTFELGHLQDDSGYLLIKSKDNVNHTMLRNNGDSYLNVLGGNVGIGITNPDSPLHVQGNFKASHDTTNATIMGNFLSASGKVSSQLRMWNEDDEINVSISNDTDSYFKGGNVGIGTTSPSAPLEISTTNDEAVRINQGAGAPWNYLSFYQEDQFKGYVGTVGSDDSDLDGGLTLTALAGENLYLRTAAGSGANTDNRITVLNSNGNVGIGYFTSSAPPTRTLDVNGDINFSGNIYQNGSAVSFDTAAGGGSGSLWSSSGSDLHYNSGNVGIGTTSPDHKLHVNGDGYFAGDSVPNIAPAAGVYLGKSENSADHHVSIITSTSLSSYIDFSNTTRDAIGRILYANPSTSWPTGQGMCFYADYTGKHNSPDVFIDPTGNVGIGTASPGYKLHIAGGTPAMKLEGTQPRIWLSETDQTDLNTIIRNNNSTFQIDTASDEDAFIANRFSISNTSGNVGIGTSAPECPLMIQANPAGDSMLKLIDERAYVEGEERSGISFQGKDSNDLRAAIAGIEAYGASSGRGGLRFLSRPEASSTAVGMVLNEDSNVGIGTTSPNANLEIFSAVKPIIRLTGTGNNTLNTNFGEIQFYNRDESGDGPNVAASIHAQSHSSTGSGGSLVFSTEFGDAGVEGQSAEPRMTILSNGNVGIGATSPDAKLHILGGDSDVRDLVLQYSGTSGSTEQNIVWKDFRGQVNASIGNALNGDSLNEPEGSMNFRVGDGTSTLRDAMHIKSNGNVGIGTNNPLDKLMVAGNIKAWSETGNAAILGSEQSGLTTIKLMTQGDSFLTGGNVGIGTTSPDHKLDVRGNARIGDSDDITPNEQGTNSHLQINGSGYSGFVSLDADAMHIGHNSNIRDLYLSTNETPRLSITSNGNVGIGTSAPECPLMIQANPSGDSILKLIDERAYVEGEERSAISFQGKDSNDLRAAIAGIEAYSASSGRGGLRFLSRTEASSTAVGMVLNEDGNVGVGTTSPGYGKLVVAGQWDGSGSDGVTLEFNSTTEKSVIESYCRAGAGTGANAGFVGTKPLEFSASDYTFDSGGSAAIKILSNHPNSTGIRLQNNGSSDSTWTMTARSAGDPLQSKGFILTYGLDSPTVENSYFVMDSIGNLNINTVPYDAAVAGSSHGKLRVKKYNMTTGTYVSTGVEGSSDVDFNTAVNNSSGSTHRSAELGIFRPGAAECCGYLKLPQHNGSQQFFWVDEYGQLKISTNNGLIGGTGGTVLGTQTSDERLKNIKPDFSYGLEQVMQLNPIEYSFKSDGNSENRLGFGAQSVVSVIPESVSDTQECIDGYDQDEDDSNKLTAKSEDTKLVMEYAQLIPVLTKAIQELKAENDDLKSRLESIEEWRGNSV